MQVAVDLTIEIDIGFLTREYLGMSKLAPNQVGWTPPSAADLDHYELRVVAAGAALDYTVPGITVAKDATSYDFATNPDYAGKQGEFDVGLSAVDVAGNESDITVLKAVPIDFVPPDAPANFHRL